jgi:undecaprenyl-diphosphatase
MIDYVVLGVIQGLTEFLPISSSAHLVLAERLLGMYSPGVLFEASLHLGTLAAILVWFRSDIAELLHALTRQGSIERRKEIGLLVLATVPILVVGLLLRGEVDALFSSLWIVSIGLLASGSILLATARRRASRRAPRALDAVAIGLAQAASILPGVSRSGTTIGIGILSGVAPDRAARFSFLLAIPAIAGAGIVSVWDAVKGGTAAASNVGGILVGTLVAFLVGLAAIRFLLAVVARGRLWIFALYCLALGTAVLLWQVL